MKYVIFIGGLIGTGKTSVAKGVANKLGFYYYDVDAVKKEIYPTDPNYEYNLKNNVPFSDETRIKTFEKVVADFADLSHKYDYIIVDETLHKKDLRQILFDGAKKHFGKYLVVWINANEDIIKNRLTQNERKGHILKDPFGMYLSFKNQFEDFDKFDIVFENNTSLEDSIEDLSKQIKEILFYNKRMLDILSDINEENVKKWSKKENLEKKNKREFEGFQITDSIDGSVMKNREVSLIEINENKKYPQHYHKDSDTFFIIVSGEATLLSEDKKVFIKAGNSFPVPRGVWHGFELKKGQNLAFISVQSPPIKNIIDKKEDFIKNSI